MKKARAIVALAAEHDLELFSADIVAAFLEGKIDKETYVELPEGFHKPGDKNTVGRLNKALYGCRQAPRQFWLTITEHLLKIGFKQTRSDPCLFHRIDNNRPTIVGVYVDDIEVAATMKAKDKLLQQLRKRFDDVKDLGHLRHILGIKVISNADEGTYHLSQPAIVDRLVKQANLEDAMPRPTPLQPGLQLTKAMCPSTPAERLAMRERPFRSILGALLYLALGTRPDISYAVSTLSRYAADPGERHWNALKHLLRYLKGTSNYGIRFGKTGSVIFESFSDADWATNEDDRKSITGWFIRMAGGPLCWQSQKQKCVATSTMEAELIALAAASSEVLWWRQMLSEIGCKQKQPSLIHEDNQSCIAFLNNTGPPRKAKHIDLRLHFVRDEIAKGKIKLRYIASKDNVADIFTKPLGTKMFRALRTQLSVTQP